MSLARLVGSPPGYQPRCPAPLEDPSDRAQRHRVADLERVYLDFIGFWHGNRGMGISAHHVHDIAHDIVANRTQKGRYDYVMVVEIPEEFLAEVRRINAEMAKSDPLMPQCHADKIKYVCLGKTHFVHAQKLGKDGGRTLYNMGVDKIVWQQNDTEGAACSARGPTCAIYQSSLWYDADAMNALSLADNLNANVAMGEDEMQAFGRIDTTLLAVRGSGMQLDTLSQQVLERVRLAGLGTFTHDDWKLLIAFRVGLPDAVATIFQRIQNSACMSRVRVRVGDFGIVSKFNQQAPFAKVAVLLNSYLSAVKTMDTAINVDTFAGRQEVTARPLPKEPMRELMSEAAFLLEVHTFLLEMMKTYSKPQPPTQSATPESITSSLRDARGDMFAHAGRLISRVAQAIDTAVKKEKHKFSKLSLDARMIVIKCANDGQLAQIEQQFRSKVVQLKLWEDASLPGPKFPVRVGHAQASSQGAAGGSGSGTTAPSNVEGNAKSDGVDVTPGDEFGEGAGATRLTKFHVFQQLGISGLGEQVMCLLHADGSAQESPHEIPVPQGPAQDPPGPPRAVKAEPVDNPGSTAVAQAQAEPTDAGPSTHAKTLAWTQVQLKTLMLPDHAEVEVLIPKLEGPGDLHVRKVRLADLRPVLDNPDKDKDLKEKKSLLHPSLQESGDPLEKYDFDVCADPTLISFVTHTLHQSHLATVLNVEQLDVFCVSEKNKMPIALQVRAAVDFKKGQLCLFPAGAIVLPDSESTARLFRRHGMTNGRGCANGKERMTLHDSMLLYVDGVARSALKSLKRKKPDDDADVPQHTVATVRLVSPLLSGKDEKDMHAGCFKNLAPFWALLRTPKASTPANMDFGVLGLKDQSFELIDAPRQYKWPRLMKTMVELPYAINTQIIKKGDILTLPFFQD